MDVRAGVDLHAMVGGDGVAMPVSSSTEVGRVKNAEVIWFPVKLGVQFNLCVGARRPGSGR